MIIFLILLILSSAILFYRWKLKIEIELQNTDSHIGIHFLWMHLIKKGKLSYQKKEKASNQMRKKKSKTNTLFWLWFFRHIQYENVSIEEQVGCGNPVFTSLAIPALSIITTIPLHFLSIRFENFKYHILPNYQHTILKIHIQSIASFQLICLLKSIIQEKVHKLYSRN